MAIRQNHGRLEVICGPMFSGKSEELIRRIRRSQIAKQRTELFKHCSDNRKSLDHVDSHGGTSLGACALGDVACLERQIAPDTQVIGIDEVQFFSMDIIMLIDKLTTAGRRVIVAGLDLDFRGIPFGCMPVLLALADEVIKLKAVCMSSGEDAHFTQRMVNGRPAKHTDPIIMIGAEECYEARSHECYEIDYKPLAEYVKHHFER